MPRTPAELFTPYGRVILALIAVLGIVQVYRWLAARRLGAGYGVLWSSVFVALLVVAAFPITAFWVSWLLGARDPEGGLRLGAFVFAFVMLLYMSVKTSQLQRRIEELTQALALKDARATDDPKPPDVTS